jgi:hypothetical protein
MEAPCRLFRISSGVSMFAILEESVFCSSIQMQVEQEALCRRGWVVQERIFARRTLYFGQRVHWECRPDDCSETSGWQFDDFSLTRAKRTLFDVSSAQLLKGGSSAIDLLRA